MNCIRAPGFLLSINGPFYSTSDDAPVSDRKDLLSELELMKTLQSHPHVIKLLGCVTESGITITGASNEDD